MNGPQRLICIVAGVIFLQAGVGFITMGSGIQPISGMVICLGSFALIAIGSFAK